MVVVSVINTRLLYMGHDHNNALYALQSETVRKSRAIASNAFNQVQQVCISGR